MKYITCIILTSSIMGLRTCTGPADGNITELADFPLEVPEQHSLMSRWEKKPVLDSCLIDDMEEGTGWKLAESGEAPFSVDYQQKTGLSGEISYTTDRAVDGKQSLRFLAQLRNEELIQRNRTRWGSFNAGFGGYSCVYKSFDTPQDWTSFNRVSFWVYVHPSSVPTHCLRLFIENEGTVATATSPQMEHVVQDLKEGMWNHVLFEIPHLERNMITRFSICQEQIGHHPEGEDFVVYYIDRFELQRVEADQYEGWNVAPGKISYNHIGYRPHDPKIALAAADDAGELFHLVDERGNAAFTGHVRVLETSTGRFHQLDFSEFRDTGTYRIRCGSLESNSFPIHERVWLQPVFKATNFYYCQRCGYHVPGIHLECHQDWQGFHGDVTKIINGGWHDAGDCCQGYWRTALASFALMRNLEQLQEQEGQAELAERLRKEIGWGLEWLLRARFWEGFHMSWSVMRIYTDNQVGTMDDVVTPARNVPWENFLAAAVLCKAALMLESTDPELTQQASVAAVEDWQAAVSSREPWNDAGYREASWGVISSLLLNELTKDESYKEQAVHFGYLLMKCQEQRFLDAIPVTGFFYTSTNREQIIHNNHTAFDEAPMIALTMLCRTIPGHKDWMDWYGSVVMYSDFFLKRGSRVAAPYCLLPNSVWSKAEIMSEKDPQRLQENLRQYLDGTPLNDEYVIRTFPIWSSNKFHGNTNIQLSGTWALAEASGLRGDPDGMRLVGKQLEWIFGANPFGQSLMYGVGFDFTPLFAARLKNIVGALPVGMDCMSGDRPYWPATNYATNKEIWIEPVSRFLGAVSAYGIRDQIPSSGEHRLKDLKMMTQTVQTDDGKAEITVTLSGSGKQEIEVRTFNARVQPDFLEVDLVPDKPETIGLELVASDMHKPFIALISARGTPDLREEIIGSFNKSSLDIE
jgi:hypothetical protein